MKTADFDFVLPEDRIAQTPAKPRDSARLLVVGPGSAGGFLDRRVSDLPDILRPGDLMIFNDTKVIPAQLRGKRGEAGIDVTLLRRDAGDARLCQALARPAKKLRAGDVIRFGGGESVADQLGAVVVGQQEAGEIALRFDCDEGAVMAAIHRLGSMPLPPYIRKLRPVAKADEADYQTVYARHEGAVAAPTAGLHFTPELLAALDRRGIERAHVTLHVGAGTFLPVKVDDVADHKMHSEWG
ncbi:MAG: S-adenosylmethionine:tRNA ribosyltransferase-isomerase, partial [Dongia sp.]